MQYLIINLKIVPICRNRKSQLVEDRKIYVRRVSSNVADLRKGLPLTVSPSRHVKPTPMTSSSNDTQPGAGLFETFLVVALYYDRQLHRHTPYIKSSYPNHVIIAPALPVGGHQLHAN